MSEEVSRSDGNQGGHEIWWNTLRLRPGGVQPHHKEADGDVKCFARHFMLVNECSPVSMDGNKTEGARTTAKVPPRPP